MDSITKPNSIDNLYLIEEIVSILMDICYIVDGIVHFI